MKIVGRANFSSSIDFKSLVNQLQQKGYNYFVLELSECLLMDSTFLGVLARLGIENHHYQSWQGLQSTQTTSAETPQGAAPGSWPPADLLALPALTLQPPARMASRMPLHSISWRTATW